MRERLRELEDRLERVRAEIQGIESGVLIEVEASPSGILASDIAERLGITPQAVNNHLKRLRSADLIRMERQRPAAGGRQYKHFPLREGSSE